MPVLNALFACSGLIFVGQVLQRYKREVTQLVQGASEVQLPGCGPTGCWGYHYGYI